MSAGSGLIPARVIEAKRDGERLGLDALEGFLRGYLDGGVEEYQMAAFLMAAFFRGFGPEEIDTATRVMIDSGETLDLSRLDGPRVDKHSTGGVGDKVSLALAPLVAEAGVYVPMMSGRGLGHTGGTLDKLEAIPGFRTDLPLGRFVEALERVGCAMIGQTDEIAPLDKRLYDLRSVTGTVPSIPLIATSIMSKKLAEDLSGLVLDVKVGEGAFIREEERAFELARTMVGIGSSYGVPTVALATAMDRPLGRAVGNALETAEAVACLEGEGPSDLREVVLALATEMVLLAESAGPGDAGAVRSRLEGALDDGSALERFRRMVEEQGGDPAVADDPGAALPGAPEIAALEATSAGWVVEVTPTTLGYGVIELGGGRTGLGQEIDPAVGFVLAVEPGRKVERGEVLGRVHARSRDDLDRGLAALSQAIRIEEEPGRERGRPLISHRITAGGVEAL